MFDMHTNFQYIHANNKCNFYKIGSEKVRIVRILNERLAFLHQRFGRNLKSVDAEENDHE